MTFIPQTARGRIAALGALVACLLPQPAALAFEFNDVARRAAELAAAPPRKADGGLPKELQSLDYGQYHAIRFRPEKFLWRGTGLPFELAFFHRGWRWTPPSPRARNSGASSNSGSSARRRAPGN